jgi:predicted TIM-barrel fold metal-dependent hydrolase
MSLPPLITVEEHFFSTAAIPTFTDTYSEQLKHLPHVLAAASDLGSLRLKDMDAGLVSFQIISHGPGTLPPPSCRAANNQLAAAVKEHPDRFAGFAVLPMSYPDTAATELERCIKRLGFKGALVDNHVNGIFYDGKEFEVFWRKAEELDVPIYLHPTWPSEDMKSRYEGNFSEGASLSLGASGFGWHSEVGMHILRLFASGLFDRFPKLKVIIGHMGEMLPAMLDRIIQLSPRWGKFERGFRRVWDENVWITTSGVWSVDPMATILRNTRIERVMYSVDYPFARNERGLEWIRELERSGMVDREGLEMIAYRNAEKLLGVKAPARV